MSSKDSLITRSLALMVPSWEHKVSILLASHSAWALIKFEAHCAWLQTCRSLPFGHGGHESEPCARSYRFPAAPQPPLQGDVVLVACKAYHSPLHQQKYQVPI